MKTLGHRVPIAALAICACLAACVATPAQQQQLQQEAATALIDGVVCAADAKAIGGKTVAVALTLVTDPACKAALATAVPAAKQASALVTLQQ